MKIDLEETDHLASLMTNDLPEELEALTQFLYHVPIGLIQADRCGYVGLMNPVSARLLMPLAPAGDLSNVFDALGGTLPDLRLRIDDFDASHGVVCENLRLHLHGDDGDRRRPSVLALTVVKLDPNRLMLVLQDITITVRRERALREREAWFSALLTGIRDYALVHLDENGLIARWNESIERVTGYTAAEVIGQPFTRFQTEESHTAETIRDRLDEADANGWILEEGWRLRADGSRFWASALLAPLDLPEGDCAESRVYSLILRDISDKRAASEALRRAMRCDQLTGLLNRHAFFEAAETELSRRQRQHRALSMVMIDADHFKQINDRYGHPGGDLVLGRLAELLAENCREVDVIARMGGEEFVVLMPSAGLEDAWRVAERFRAAVESAGIAVGEGTARVTVSAGVAMLGASESDLDTLIRRADRALYRAKGGGRNRVARLAAEDDDGLQHGTCTEDRRTERVE